MLDFNPMDSAQKTALLEAIQAIPEDVPVVEPTVASEIDPGQVLPSGIGVNKPWYDFVTAPRFWVMILGCMSATLLDPSFPINPWYLSAGGFIEKFTVGFLAIATYDRTVDKFTTK